MAKDEIRRGYEFPGKEEKFWQVLREGQGVVVFPMGTLGYRAYDYSYDQGTEEGKRSLRQNLAGADRTFEGRAWLVTRENGRLIWRTKEQLNQAGQEKSAAVLPKRRNQPAFAGAC